MGDWENKNNNGLLVSVLCQTYNHEHYIGHCLEGIVNQKTSFLIEILVHDDASTDKTANIIREYEKRYPDILKPIYQMKNQFSQGRKVFSGIQVPRAKGKYIAICEGDDYWTDPFKLQKQVDFLETNEEYVLSYTDFNTIDKNGIETNIDLRRRSITPSGNVLSFLVKRNFIKLLTVVMRTSALRSAIHELAGITEFRNIDYSLFFEMGGFGQVHYLNEKTASYRLLQESASHSINYKNRLKFLENTHKIKSYYNRKYQLGRSNRQLSLELVNNQLSILSQSKKGRLFLRYFFRGIDEDFVHLILPVNYFHFMVLILRKLKL